VCSASSTPPCLSHVDCCGQCGLVSSKVLPSLSLQCSSSCLCTCFVVSPVLENAFFDSGFVEVGLPSPNSSPVLCALLGHSRSDNGHTTGVQEKTLPNLLLLFSHFDDAEAFDEEDYSDNEWFR